MKIIRPDKVGFNLTIPYPGTEIYRTYVRPPLRPHEYVVYEHSRLFCEIRDPRFRLTAHNLDLAKLHFKANLSNYLNPFFDFIFDKRYIRKLLQDKKKKDYLKAILGTVFKQVKSYLRFLKRAY